MSVREEREGCVCISDVVQLLCPDVAWRKHTLFISRKEISRSVNLQFDVGSNPFHKVLLCMLFQRGNLPFISAF